MTLLTLMTLKRVLPNAYCTVYRPGEGGGWVRRRVRRRAAVKGLGSPRADAPLPQADNRDGGWVRDGGRAHPAHGGRSDHRRGQRGFRANGA